jgi:hypothetical protein
MKTGKAAFKSVRVVVGGEQYYAIVRAIPARAPAHAGADSPRFLDPGRPARVEVMKILLDGIDVTAALMPWTRRKIEDHVREQAAS